MLLYPWDFFFSSTPIAPSGIQNSYFLGPSRALLSLSTGENLCFFLPSHCPLLKSWLLLALFIQVSFSTPQGRKPVSLNPEW
jgi:hypothetical protein